MILSTDGADSLIEDAYRLLLGREPDAVGRLEYRRLLKNGRMNAVDLFRVLVSSTEFQHRLSSGVWSLIDEETLTRQESTVGLSLVRPDDPSFIDVACLIEQSSLDDLAMAADEYFRSALPDPDHLLSKPFVQAAEASELLITFGHLLGGLRPLPGMDVLDFGAGTCWTTHALAQLGCKVTALDISATALELGRELFRRQPLIGSTPEPSFLVFNGRRIELGDESFDRICVFDSFHHVPNPSEVIGELCRVLRPGGVIGFSEPGANHSRYYQSQLEMRMFGVVENDIVMEDISAWAEGAGLMRLELEIFASQPFRTDLLGFTKFLNGGEGSASYVRAVQDGLGDRRMFFLRKPGAALRDSRDPSALSAQLTISDVKVSRESGVRIVRAVCCARNVGGGYWYPSRSPVAPVSLGVKVNSEDGRRQVDFARVQVPGDAMVEPGAEVEMSIEVRIEESAHAGPLRLEFDMVADGVSWFSTQGSVPVLVDVTV